MEARLIGEREFTDGIVRLVYEDDQGQYVLDADGQPVRGVWLLQLQVWREGWVPPA